MANGGLAHNPISSVPNTAVTMVAIMDGKEQGKLCQVITLAIRQSGLPRRRQLLAGSAPVQRSCSDSDRAAGRNWSIIPLTPAINFSPSVVVEAGPTMIRYFHWETRRGDC
jgi:hypothetical protein